MRWGCGVGTTHPCYAIGVLVRLNYLFAALIVASSHTCSCREQIQHLKMTNFDVVVIAEDKRVWSRRREVIWRHDDFVGIRLDVPHCIASQCAFKELNSRIGPVGVWVCLRAMIDEKDAQRFFINHVDAHAVQIVGASSICATEA